MVKKNWRIGEILASDETCATVHFGAASRLNNDERHSMIWPGGSERQARARDHAETGRGASAAR